MFNFDNMLKIFKIGKCNNYSIINNSYQKEKRKKRNKLWTNYVMHYPNLFFQYNNTNIATRIIKDEYICPINNDENGENISLKT